MIECVWCWKQCRLTLFLTMRVDKCVHTSKCHLCAWANYVQPMH